MKTITPAHALISVTYEVEDENGNTTRKADQITLPPKFGSHLLKMLCEEKQDRGTGGRRISLMGARDENLVQQHEWYPDPETVAALTE